MNLSRDYQVELRKFVSGQHLQNGIRVTACVIIPAWLLYHYGLLSTMISLPLGALFVGLADNPGPIHHRRNGLLVSSLLNFVVALVAGVSRFNPWLIGVEIFIFGILSSLVSVFGTRAGSIGLTALIIFILGIEHHEGSEGVWNTAAYFLAGGLWYTLVSLSITTLRPFRPVQQLLGECLMQTSAYLQTKARFYERDPDVNATMIQLMEQQVQIHQSQELLRSILFTTRRFISQATGKGRILTMMFRDSLDLFERAVTSQHDYIRLQKEFSGTDILDTFRASIGSMANILYAIGLSVQEGATFRNTENIQVALDSSVQAFEKLRKEKLNPTNVEAFINLRHVLNTLTELAERLKQLGLYTTFDRKLSGDFSSDEDFSRFTTSPKINFSLILSNLSFRSSVFRHAIRLTIALLLGYLMSLFFPLGHGYWILLTIATIIKPAYSLTKQRNLQRLAGTFAGAALGFVVLYFYHNDAGIFIVMLAMMVLAYTFLKLNYAVSIACLTVYLLLSFHFLYPQGLNNFLLDRVIDTALGSVLAYIVSYFVLPAWEYQQIDKLMKAWVAAGRQYFITVAGNFVGKPPDTTSYKMVRKEAFVTLANLSDAFQRMLSDPKNQQPNLPLYHQFVSAAHMLTSHVALLSNYAIKHGATYQHPGFQPLINIIDGTFARIDTEDAEAANPSQAEWQSSPILKRIRRLIEQRKKDLETGLETTPADARKTLNELVTITDQLRLIQSTAEEMIKILREIRMKGTDYAVIT